MSICLKLEHLVMRGLKRGHAEKWLLAVSGGVDSLVMAEIVFRWRRYLGVELAVAHVHHGLSSAAAQNRFRQRACNHVLEWAGQRRLTFLTNPPLKDAGTSEDHWRQLRLKHLRRWRREGGFDRIVLAHHFDDLLETRLLRVLRGVGPQGLRAMAPARGRVLRPMLRLTRAQIVRYAKERDLKWIEDPSNQKDISLRNWLRHSWLPQLERRSPGAVAALGRSLTTLAGDRFTETIGPFVGLRRAALEKFPSAQHADIVARYLRSVGVKGYSQTHVQELLKRLEPRQNLPRFQMLGFSFEANPDFLWAGRVEFE